MSVLTHLFGSGDLRLQESGYRIVSAAVSVLPMFGVILFAHAVREKLNATSTVPILLAYILAGAVRGLCLAGLLSLNPEIDDAGWLFRIPTSIITMGATVLILSFVVASYGKQQQAIADLVADTSQLRQSLEEIEIANTARDLSAVQTVAETVVAELKKLRLHPRENQISEIQQLVESQVRPLSKKYAVQIRTWLPDKPEQQRQSFKDFWLKLNPVSRFPSIWLLVPLSLTPVPATINDFGWVAGLEIALLTFFFLTSAVLLGSLVTSRLLVSLPSPLKEILFSIVLFVISVVGVSAAFLALLDTPNPHTYTVIGLIAFPVYAWVVTIGLALLDDLQRTQAELTKTQDRLRWAIARVNLLSWYSKGVVTRLLHGPIQNSMHVTLIKLQGSDFEVDDALNELTDRIQKASADLGLLQTPEELLARFHETTSIWGEVSDLELEVSDFVAQVLSRDPAAAGIVLDLCNEELSNAIRHGKATRAKITLTAVPDTLHITLQHDGQVRKPIVEDGSSNYTKISRGLGTKFLESCSVAFETKTDASKSSTLTTIALPLDTEHPVPANPH